MDQGAYRSRAFHRVGQPHVQRELRRLAHGANEEHETNQREHAGSGRRYGRCLSEDFVVVQRPEDIPRQQETDQEANVADAVRQEGFDGGRGCRLTLEPEPNQEVRAETDGFPEDEQDQQVVRHHEHDHREDEQRQIGEEPPKAGIVVHVSNGINVDHERNARHHEQHDEREGVHAQRNVQREVTGNRPRPQRDRLWFRVV